MYVYIEAIWPPGRTTSTQPTAGIVSVLFSDFLYPNTTSFVGVAWGVLQMGAEMA